MRSLHPRALVFAAALFAAPTMAAGQRYTPPAADIEPLALGGACAAEANADVDRGTALLVVLAREEARRAFERASVTDPDCALAYWGRGASHLPSAAEPLTSAALDAVADAAGRAASVPARTEIERGLVEALTALVMPATTPVGVRLDTYETKLRKLAETHRSVDALQILHARAALLRTTMPRDPARVRARRLVETAFAERAAPWPAGAAVVLIESGEGESSAAIAERGAAAVARVRVPQPHLLAMRALVAAGLWNAAEREGQAAIEHAGSTAAPSLLYGSPASFAPEWLVEALLQQGRRTAARALLARLTSDLERLTLDGDHHAAIRLAVTRATTRLAIDERSSPPAANDSNAAAHDWPWSFGVALNAAWHAWPGGDAARLRMARDHAGAMAATGDAGPERELANTLLDAAIAATQDEHGQVTLFLSHAADLETRLMETGRLSLPLLPAHELAAEIWQRFYRYPDAEREARAALARFPNRWRALLTLARAASESGQPDRAREALRQLEALREHADPGDPVREEARRGLR